MIRKRGHLDGAVHGGDEAERGEVAQRAQRLDLLGLAVAGLVRGLLEGREVGLEVRGDLLQLLRQLAGQPGLGSGHSASATDMPGPGHLLQHLLPCTAYRAASMTLLSGQQTVQISLQAFTVLAVSSERATCMQVC